MYLDYEISDGMIIISLSQSDNQGDIDMGSISIPIIEIGNELMKNDAFVNSLHDKFKRIEQSKVG